MKIFLLMALMMDDVLSGISQTIYIANNDTGAVTGANVFTGNA